MSNSHYLTGDNICNYFNTKKSTIRKKKQILLRIQLIQILYTLVLQLKNPFEDEYNDNRNNVDFDISKTPKTLLNKYSTDDSLDNTILQGKYEPTECMDVDMNNILSELKNNPI